jgi:hypothetical protein
MCAAFSIIVYTGMFLRSYVVLFFSDSQYKIYKYMLRTCYVYVTFLR